MSTLRRLMDSGDNSQRAIGRGWVVRAYDEQDRLQAKTGPIRSSEEAVEVGRAWLRDGIGFGLPAITRITWQYVSGGVKYPEHDREPEP